MTGEYVRPSVFFFRQPARQNETTAYGLRSTVQTNHEALAGDVV
jgi:hypothetical protein